MVLLLKQFVTGGVAVQKSSALTAASEDYLEAIYHLTRQGDAARSRDIAEKLDVHKSTVTAALKVLKNQNLINYSPYEAVTLTSEGAQAAQDVVRRHTVLKDFFISILKVDENMAETAACGMEHALPREIVDRLTDFAVSMRKPQTPDMAAKAGKRRPVRDSTG